MSEATLSDRLKQARHARGLSARGLSVAAGLNPTYVRDLEEERTKQPSAASMEALASVLAVDSGWLHSGRGDAPVFSTPEEAKAAAVAMLRANGGPQTGQGRRSVSTLADVIYAPRLDTAVSAGHGAVPDRGEVLHRWPLPRTWLRNDLGVPPESADVITIRGDSMAPTFQDGDLVIVDRSDTAARGAGVFVLWDGDGLVLKRIQAVPTAPGAPPRYRVLSDNPAYDAYEVDAAWVTIVGRARARIGRV